MTVEEATRNLVEAIRPYAEGRRDEELRSDILVPWDELDKLLKDHERTS